jgi:ABC-type sugar transport system substrate-binding protein
MAIGTILAARDFGLQVPQDLSVVGMDGHELGETFGLTTVDQDPRRQGVLAATTALQLLEAGTKDSASGSMPAEADQEFPTEVSDQDKYSCAAGQSAAVSGPQSRPPPGRSIKREYLARISGQASRYR